MEVCQESLLKQSVYYPKPFSWLDQGIFVRHNTHSQAYGVDVQVRQLDMKTTCLRGAFDTLGSMGRPTGSK
jgi:hypothetical protein